MGRSEISFSSPSPDLSSSPLPLPHFFFFSREEKRKQLYSREGSGEEKEWKGSDERVLQLLGEWDFGGPTDPMLPRP